MNENTLKALEEAIQAAQEHLATFSARIDAVETCMSASIQTREEGDGSRCLTQHKQRR